MTQLHTNIFSVKLLYYIALLMIGMSAVTHALPQSKMPVDFQIKSRIYKNDSLISSPSLIILENQQGSLTIKEPSYSKLKIDFKAEDDITDQQHTAIKVYIKFLYQDRIETIRKTITIVVNPHQLEVVKFHSDLGNRYVVQVIAERRLIS